MDNPYLLIVNEHYYPSPSTGDWLGTFSTYEEADNKGKELVDKYRDYFVIDLRNWVNDNV